MFDFLKRYFKSSSRNSDMQLPIISRVAFQAGLPVLFIAAIVCTGVPAIAADKGTAVPGHDYFYWLGEFNKASTVMVVESGIVPRPLGAGIARAVGQVIAEGNRPGAKRPSDYLQVEPLIIAIAGPDASRMHSGRSRQDILATTRRVMQRDRLLDLMDAMNDARVRILDLAERSADTIIPAYTNGVQAQPTTYGHYLLAFASAFDRDGERLRQAYDRLNLCPLGSAALGTSSFPVDRLRLAALLGFDGVLLNSYDATQVAPRDEGAEMAEIAINMALTVGGFVQDVHTQYHQTSPWIMLREGKLTGPSSIMPQKRNPYGLNVLRLKASDVAGTAMTAIMDAHNVESGMPDYKRDKPEKALEGAAEMYDLLSKLIDALVIDRKRALEEVEADYSTTTELADVLQRESGVPFRIGHHFASELVTYGRDRHLKPSEIPFSTAQRIYAESAESFGMQNCRLPLSEERFRQSLSATGMIGASRGMGGPQPAEVKRMLVSERGHLAEDREWLELRRARLRDADDNLQKAFAELKNQYE